MEYMDQSLNGVLEKVCVNVEDVKPDVAERKAEVFHRFSLFPPEIRQMIYSKMTLSDRISASEATQEMEEYFTKHRVKDGYVKISVEEEEDHAHIRVKFPVHGCVEFYRIPDELVDSVQRDLQSSKGCRCDFCVVCDDHFGSRHNCGDGYDHEEKADVHVRYFDYDPHNVHTVFETFRLVETPYFHMKSAPVGGLVDLLVPVGQLREPSQLNIHWHVEENFLRHEPNVCTDRWGKWFDFARPTSIVFSTNYEKEGSDSDISDTEDWDTELPVILIPKQFYDSKAFINAKSIHQHEVSVNINFQQLCSLKANEMSIYLTSKFLTPFDMLAFYKLKIKEWLSAPDTKMWFCIGHEEKCRHRPYLNCQLLLADVREESDTPDFRVYPNYYFFNPFLSTEKTISIRSMKTGRSLVVSITGLQTGVPSPDSFINHVHVWPEKHGL